MLPSIRLIAVTFCCGFIVVFAGLRLASQINGVHEAMPVMAAQAAPVTVAAAADRDQRRALPVVPMMYDLRFAVSMAPPVSARPPAEAQTQIMMPLAIRPPAMEFLEAAIAPQVEAKAASETDAKTEVQAVAAVAPQAISNPAPVVIDIPTMEPAPVDLSFAEPAKARTSLAAAPLPPTAPRALIEIPMPEPAIVDLTFSPQAKPEPLPPIAALVPRESPEAGPTVVVDIPLAEPAPVDLTPSLPAEAASSAGAESGIPDGEPQTDARAKAQDKPIALAAVRTEDLIGTVKLPTKRIPLPRVRTEIKTRAPAEAVALEPAPSRPIETASGRGAESDIPESDPQTGARAKLLDDPIAVAALRAEDLIGTVKLPTRRIPLPRVRAEIKAKALVAATTPVATKAQAASKPKPKPRRTVAATPSQPDFDKFFGGPAASLPQGTLPGATHQ